MSFYVMTSELSHHGIKGMKWGVRKQKLVKSARKYGRTYANTQRAYASKHSTGGIVVRKIGKTFVQQAAVSFAAIPVAAIAGPAAPVAMAGMRAVSVGMGLKNTADAGVSIAYRHKVLK